MASRFSRRSKSAAFFLGTAALAAFTVSASAAVDLTKVTGPAAPSFRGASSTTYFGWAPKTFAGPTETIINNPAPTLGTTTAGVGLVQNDTTVVILAASKNIYTNENNLDITATAPTAGTPGTGFTTIIVQGKTAGGPFGTALSFADIGGATADQKVATNAAGSDQFFVKYQIPGNAATYPIHITGGDHNSINDLEVDTLWSPTAYATDFAVTPEPTSIAAIGSLLVGGAARRRRLI